MVVTGPPCFSNIPTEERVFRKILLYIVLSYMGISRNAVAVGLQNMSRSPLFPNSYESATDNPFTDLGPTD